MKDDHTINPHSSSQVPPGLQASDDATAVDAHDMMLGTGLGTGLSPVGAPIPIEINRTLAELLARLCVELGTEDHVGVLSRALGLLEMVQRTKRQGGRLCFINERGETADVIA
ncbi:MAG: hypothetical protein KBG15_01300 [Kofleriaceae bacterium]|nr:hypothetical protein [Kofleriaceae bacterium]